MKRFTDTTKWDNPWFWELSPPAKLLWLFLCDHCDNAGVADVSLRLASVKIGQTIQEKHLTELASRLHTLENGKRFIRSFIRFQYGTLRPECKPHASVISLLSRHGLNFDQLSELCKQYPNSMDTPSGGIHTSQDQEKDQDQGKEKEKEQEGSVEGNRILRLNALFRRRAETLWSESELRAYRKAGVSSCPLEDFELIEAYYRSGAQYLRRDLQTLLNNWNGELDRARQWKQNPNATNQRNNSSGHRPITGAEQRQVGIPDTNRTEDLGELLAARSRRAVPTPNTVATTPPATQHDQSGGSTHG